MLSITSIVPIDVIFSCCVFVQAKCVIHVIYGDFQEDLEQVARHLRNAIPYASEGVELERLKW